MSRVYACVKICVYKIEIIRYSISVVPMDVQILTWRLSIPN